jgi:hypothetical protein
LLQARLIMTATTVIRLRSVETSLEMKTMEKDNLDRTSTGGATGGSFGTQADTTRTGTMGTSSQATPGVVDTNAEEAYWRQNYASRPYVAEGISFIEYRPAYRYGADAYSRYQGKSFDEAEPEMANEWDRFKGTSSLTWENAKHAARDAWQRVRDTLERVMPGDSDRDGK